jgi:hypothetical protein
MFLNPTGWCLQTKAGTAEADIENIATVINFRIHLSQNSLECFFHDTSQQISTIDSFTGDMHLAVCWSEKWHLPNLL